VVDTIHLNIGNRPFLIKPSYVDILGGRELPMDGRIRFKKLNQQIIDNINRYMIIKY